MIRRALRRDAGMTILEVLIASGILAIAIVIFLTYESSALRQVDHLEDREFAVARATTMIEELKAYVEGGQESHAELLDDFDDGTATNPVLSTLKEVRSPDDPVSGNARLPGGFWKFTRRVSISKLPGVDSRDVRKVTVTVYRAEGKNPSARVLAEVSRVIRTIGTYMPPTQVVDVYALALENVPGWWVNMSTLKPLVENAFNDMQAVNPGLEFRLHWITRLSYGRDPKYAPFVNQDADASKLVNFAYFYPGVIDATGYTYYSPAQISARLNVDGEVVEPTRGEANVAGYTLADQFNAAMRAPDELAMWEARKAAGFDREPSLRVLLDDMAVHPDQYRNALMINLHGEMMPLPPVRNYSDPAKSLKFPNVRVVTHAEKLRYRGFDDVKLRVYSFVTDPDAVSGDAQLDDDVVVSIPGVDVHRSVKIERIGTGYDLTSVEADARYENGATEIHLPKSPLRSPKKGEQGLSTAARLYGWEYIPSPVEAAADFSTNLRDAGDGPKNTARWVITLPGSALPDHTVLPVDTRIGAAPADPEKDPWNHERTYVWIDETPPPSELAQFQGDPRHEPYADVKRDHRYNWFFAKVDPASGWQGWDRTQDGWAVDKVDLDVPRYFDLYRQALLQTDSIFTTMNGFSFFYVGVGGELGSDEPNGYPKGLPLNDLPYGGKGNATTFVSEIHQESRLVASEHWYSRYWLGDLFPDKEAQGFMATGNLPASTFHRVKFTDAPGHAFTFDRRRRTDRYGASAFFNAVGPTGRGPFTHRFENKNVGGA
ncbi:MAG TPA: type II secretion system protein, partial [bacterium]|nr:type II secretion system protein [bacterium]